nr:EAL domain-containing protein [Beggiatoa leptomitoformis]
MYVHIGSDQKLRSLRQHETQWSNQVRRAIAENQLQLYSQQITPIDHSISNGSCYEILVRLRTDKNELILPQQFLPVAERYSFMGHVDRWVISQVFAHLAERPLDRVDDEYIGINLSIMTLNDNSFIHFMQEQLTHLTVAPATICFELNEMEILTTLDKSSYFIQTLHEMGFSFALDRFGSGIASFDYLKRQLPVQYLKLDGRLIKNMESDMLARHIIKAIAQIAQTMGIKTIAPYVENDVLLQLISATSVDYLQGFAIAKPEPLKIYAISNITSKIM